MIGLKKHIAVKPKVSAKWINHDLKAPTDCSWALVRSMLKLNSSHIILIDHHTTQSISYRH